MRQLMHVSFKLAAKRGQAYVDLLEANQDVIARNVTFNLYQRHMKPLFVAND
jgi:tagaturonate epimerase